MTIDDVGLKPSRLQLPALLAMMPPAGAAPPTPAQAREMMEKVARLYEGIKIGNAEMRGLSVETPQGPLKLAAMRFNLENGKIGELAFEGLDARAPQGPVKVGRFALKSARHLRPDANDGAVREPGATARARSGVGAVAADPGRRDQGRRRALQKHRQAGQHRHAQPRLGPVCRSDPEPGAFGGEADDPARSGRRPVAGRRRNEHGGDRLRSRRGLDGSVAHIRARPPYRSNSATS